MRGNSAFYNEYGICESSYRTFYKDGLTHTILVDGRGTYRFFKSEGAAKKKLNPNNNEVVVSVVDIINKIGVIDPDLDTSYMTFEKNFGEQVLAYKSAINDKTSDNDFLMVQYKVWLSNLYK